ncbi:hypothetical protein [Sphingomonas sp. TREG-RG-20F-R18-01]|uniref:hypothetical protein n=1 Tax=Sphingomonas sp. TREG-RG-20F-R18-01 TaxID=2914982 RepID=UPI001F579523|nr:hypothetical protein [Sphingomonas sp. TREG-RG-20F-R18-01]
MKTHGTLTLGIDRYGKPRWSIDDLAPHVVMAFKRLFPRVPTTVITLHLSDTDEFRSDLLWFILRYPLAHDQQRAIDEGAQHVIERIAEVGAVLLPS